MLLHEIIESAPPRDPALHFDGATLTFADLVALSGQAAAIAEAAPAGSCVGIVGTNSPEYVAALYGIPKAGRVALPLNHRLTPDEIAAQMEAADAQIVVGQAADLEVLAGHVDATLASFDTTRSARPASTPRQTALSEPDPSEPVWLIFTSGTTGAAKGATLTHRSILAAVRAASSGRELLPDDVYLYPFPLCHVAAYNVLVAHLAHRPVVLARRFAPAEFGSLVARHGVTTMSLAPTMITMLLNHPDFTPAWLHGVRRVGYGAAPIPEDLLRRIAGLWPDLELSQGYGMTELSGNACFLTAADHRRALKDSPRLLLSAGRPAPGVTLHIAPDGEILIAGAQVMAGYWGRPDLTAEAIQDGFLHTGDIGRIDDDGYLYIVDRKKDIIVTGGENVSSIEVAAAVTAHPDVIEAAVIGIPDAKWGEAVCAVVTLRPDDDRTSAPEKLIAHCRQHLAGFKVPKTILVADDLPRNHSGKILKRELREWAFGEVGGDRSR